MTTETKPDPKIIDPDQYAPCYEVAGPHWPDVCGHGGYVGTVWPFVGVGIRQIIDVYVFDDKFKEGMTIPAQTLCLRYGEEGCEYYSPGEVSDLAQHAPRMEAYAAALSLLRSRGHIVWMPKEPKS